ncbi:hypothetical protein DSL92_06605 [Billgrantia gudaonensis]|uniref:Uncharacterized protein n=1 Tax=Billgrantia gudaonensis TaxID=376427 RepID=A0A3S0Q123_9GAMM|nr:hypothetical protein DSL92_06605 [Halomonas gudaonensis]
MAIRRAAGAELDGLTVCASSSTSSPACASSTPAHASTPPPRKGPRQRTARLLPLVPVSRAASIEVRLIFGQLAL